MFKLPSIVLFFLLFSNSFMVHAEKYCLKEDISKNYVINFFGESYKNEEDRRSFGEGIQKIISEFQMGDRIKMIVFNGSEALTKIDACYPGCPEKGLLDSLLDTDCQEVLAQRDKKKMEQQIRSILKQEVIKGKTNSSYNIFTHLKALDSYYRGRSINSKKIIVFHSLLPYGSNGNDSNSFDKHFIKAVQSEDLNQIKLHSKILFINPNNSRATEKFWEDLKLDNHNRGLKLNIKKEIIN